MSAGARDLIDAIRHGDGPSALALAQEYGHDAVVRLLLDAGA